MTSLFAEKFSPINAHGTLEGLRNNFPNLVGVAPSPVEAYARWATNLRTQLIGVLSRPSIERLFTGPFHTAALSTSGESQLSYANVAAQSICQRIGEIADQLKSVIDQANLSSGLPMVIDTSVILEYQPVDKVDWRAFAGEDVRLVVPLRVLEELEEMRWSNSRVKGQIARDELPRVVALLEKTPRAPSEITGQSGVTIELFDFREQGMRPGWADDEILEFYGILRQFLPRAVLVAHDGALVARAAYRGFQVRRGPPRQPRFPRTPDPDQI